MTKSFSVTDAAFANLQNNQSDFRIMGEAYVRRVALRIGSESPEVPEVPVEFIIPKETEITTGTGPYEISGHDIKIGIRQGTLRILVPDALIHSELRIYNYSGQALYHSILEQTEETIHLSDDSNFYIVVVQNENEYISRKIIVH